MVIYKATNLQTGEVIEGGSRDIARAFGITIKTVYDYVSIGADFKSQWKIERARKVKETVEYHYSPEILREWDRVTKPFKELSRKARAKRGGA